MNNLELNKLNIGRIWKTMTASGEVIDTDDKKIKESQYNMKKRLNKPTNPTIISLMKTIIFLFYELSMYKNKNHDEVNQLEEENKKLKERVKYLEFKLNEEKNKVERLKEDNYKRSQKQNEHIIHYRRQLGHDVDVNVNAGCYVSDP
tara:strand:- start:1406 stop:1846 length:441 start_codon:yes stop_codon:yes gene_type:complete